MFSVFFLSLVLSLLVLKSLGLGLDKRVVVAVVRIEALAVKMNDIGSNCVEKLAVMGHRQDGRRPRLFVVNNNYINSNNINNNNHNRKNKKNQQENKKIAKQQEKVKQTVPVFVQIFVL